MSTLSTSGIAFEPVLADWLIVTLCVIAALILALYVWRRGRAPLSRGLALVCGLLALAGPSIVRQDRKALPDVVAIIVDKSESMSLAGRAAGADNALAALRAKLSGVAGLDIRVVSMADTNLGTSLAPALDQALADVPADRVAGAIILSDGQISDAGDSIRAFPIHQALIGTAKERDRRLIVKNAPRSVPIGEIARVVVQVEDQVHVAQVDVGAQHQVGAALGEREVGVAAGVGEGRADEGCEQGEQGQACGQVSEQEAHQDLPRRVFSSSASALSTGSV